MSVLEQSQSSPEKTLYETPKLTPLGHISQLAMKSPCEEHEVGVDQPCFRLVRHKLTGDTKISPMVCIERLEAIGSR